MPSIKICSWNANGLRPKLAELKEFITRLRIDIMLINETKLDPTGTFKIKHFEVIRRDRTANGGGVAMIINNKIGFKPCKINNPLSTESLCIKLAGNIHIVATYNEPRNKMSQRDLITLTSLGNRVLIIGDLNARHFTWNNHITNANGRTLYNFVQNTNVIVQHPDSPTHFPENGMAPTCIDIVINKNVQNVTVPISIPELSSDHNPIILELHNQSKETFQDTVTSYKDTNWASFRKTLDQRININNKIKTTEDIDNELQKFTDNLTKTKITHSKLIKIGQRNIQLDDEIKNLIRIRNRIRKKYQQTFWQHLKTDINKLNRIIRTKIRDCVNKKWEKTLENVKPGDRTLWRITKSLKTSQIKIPTLTKDDIEYYTDKQKADVISQTLEEVQMNRLKSSVENKVTDTINKFFEIEHGNDLPLTSPRELRSIIKKLPTKKAPGHDNIDNRIIKNLSTKAVVQLMYIINAILKTSYFPEIWKMAVIVPIPKPNKELTNPVNYRPISLLSTLSKLTEKIILERINSFNKKHKIIIDEQFGFRSGHNTSMQVARIAHAITLNFNKANVTSLVLLDIEKAFDTVWIEGIIYKLIRYKFPQPLIKLIHNYLTGRRFQTKINTSYSQNRYPKAGVPQGSVLGPVIFSYFMNDIPKFKQTNLAVYADDTAIYSHSFNAQVATKQTQIHANLVCEFAKKWKIKLNNNKTEHIVFSRKFTNTKVYEPLRVGEMRIQQAENSIKYLGVHLDKRMSFISNTKILVNKAHKTIRMLYPLLNRNSKLSMATKRLLYTATIRPIITYASPVWCSMSKTSMTKIQRIQNKCLRLVLNKEWYTRIDELHELSGLDRIEQFVKRISEKFYKKGIKNSELTKHIILDQNQLNSLPTNKHKLIYSKINLGHH